MTNKLTVPTDTEESSDSNALTNSSSASPGLFSYFVNVISGARQTASQEFGRFWENLEHHHQNTTSTTTGTSTDAVQNAYIPRYSIKNKNDTTRMSKGEQINGRIIPDHYRRGYIKDAEIQTESFDDILSPSPVHKRKANSSLSYNYQYNRPLKKQATSVSPSPAPLVPSTKDIIDNKDDSPICSETKAVPWDYSLSANTSPIQQRQFQTRPATTSPERRKITSDVMTGSKSVRRLTHELESSFIPRSPMSPYIRTQASPRQPLDKPVATDCSYDSHKDTTSPTPTRMEDIFPMIKPQTESPVRQQQRLTAKELDERMEKLEREVGITKTKVSQFIAPTPFTPLQNITSPVKGSNLQKDRRMSDSPLFSSIKTPSSASRTSPPPPPPPQPVPMIPTSSPLRSLTANSAPFSYTASSPIRSSIKETLMAKKNEFKPTDKHKEKMQVLIQMIPDVKLRKTNIIIGADGVARPNPYWHEIYRR